MYNEVHLGGRKSSPPFLRLRNDAIRPACRFFTAPITREVQTQPRSLRELFLCPASAGSQWRLRRKIRAYDKRRNSNTAAKSLWGETAKRRIMARQLRAKIDPPPGLINPNAISGF